MTTSTEDTTSDATQDAAPDTTTTSTESTTEAPAPAAETKTETFDAAYVAKLRAESAKYRNEAKANADAARKLAEIEDANKSEAQRLADDRARAEADALSAKAEALRWKIAAKHGISEEDAELFLTSSDEETLIRQAEVLAARNQKVTTPTTPSATAAPAPAPAPRADLSQGARGAKSTDPATAFAGFIKGQLER